MPRFIVFFKTLVPVVALVIAGLLTSCSRHTPESGAKPAAMQDSPLFRLAESFPGGGSILGIKNDPSWPKFPRRDYLNQSNFESMTNFEYGLKADLAIELGTTVQVQTNRQVIVSTIIMANNDAEKGETVFDVSDWPDVRLNYWQDRDMAVLCYLAVSVSLGKEWSGKLKVLSNGVEKSATIRDVATFTQFSKMRRPKIGETDLQAIESCKVFAENPKVQESMDIDLAAQQAHYSLHAAGSVCIEDKHCGHAFDDILPGVRAWTTPRCIKRPNENFFCALRAKEDYDCPVYSEPDEDGKRTRISRGLFEYECDAKAGLYCKVEKPATLLDYAVGKCRKK